VSSLLTDMADAIVTELNSQEFSLGFRASRVNVPSEKLEDLSRLYVEVVPRARVKTQILRDRYQFDMSFLIGIRKALNSDANSESDPLIALGEEIDEHFVGGLIMDSFPDAKCKGSEFGSGDDSPWMSVQSQTEALLYTGVVIVQFVVHATIGS